MQYTEKLHWILDKPGRTLDNLDEQIRENVAFVHSLGKKCDSVGWSELKREDPRAEEILQKIQNFCNENGWSARGLYTREYTDFDTDWYELDGVDFRDDTLGDITEIPARKRGTVKVYSIKAYRELTAAPKYWGRSLYVPERFCKACRELGIKDLEFSWAEDIGKYAAEQYFEVLGLRRIPRVATAWDLEKKNWQKLGTDGGWLPRLEEIFSKRILLQLPHCYRKKDLPAGGIVYAYTPKRGLNVVLVHKDTAELLLREKAIPTGALKPVPVLDKIPSGYTLYKTKDLPKPTQAYLEQSLADCEALKKKNRPIWKVSDREALKILRKAKTDRKEDFGKKLTKEKTEALQETSYAAILPYYLVANGGCLSDEYRLLSVDESKTATEEFYSDLEKEELLQEKPDGLVICTCANGDCVLLLQDSNVIRFSHEAPEITENWPSMAQFVVDAVNEQ